MRRVCQLFSDLPQICGRPSARDESLLLVFRLVAGLAAGEVKDFGGDLLLAPLVVLEGEFCQ